MLRIAICEKDRLFQKKLLDYISKDTDIEDDYITEGFDNLADVKSRLDNRDFNFDLLFLMIDEVGVDSLALIGYIRELKFDIDIFLFADTLDFISEAFRAKVFSYMVKPLDYKKFVYEMRQYLQEKRNSQKNILSVTIQGKQQEIPLNTVLYFTSDVRKIGIFFLNDNKEIWFYGKLDELEKKVEPYGFVRCHQSYLINGYKIESVDGEEIVTAGGTFSISRKYAGNVKEKWECIRKKLYENANVAQMKRNNQEERQDEQSISSTIALTKRYGRAAEYGTIIGIRGAGKNVSYRMYEGDDILIGRDGSQVRIVVDNQSVSRKHCAVKFSAEEQCYYVCDYSKNGTAVSGLGRLPKNSWVKVLRDSVLQIASDSCAFMLV
jgi:DNA-binding LytR/AlgR family response regulator